MRRLPQSVLLSALLLGTSQWASAGLFTDEDAQKKIQVLTQENQKLRQDIKTLEERVGKLDGQLQSQGLLDLVQQLEALKAELAKIRGETEVNSHAVETAEKRQQDFYVDLDSRLRKLEGAGVAAAGSGAAPGAAPSAAGGAPVVAAAAAGTNGPAESRAYESAFNLFKIGNYQAAIGAFQNFLGTYPSSPLAPNAQYWIGNSYSALRDYKSAIAAQQKLLSLYPGSPKVPDAMLNMASSQADLGDQAAARRTLEELVAKYPASPAADIARKRLASLR
jgi:tol-pal system protein YbgF